MDKAIAEQVCETIMEMFIEVSDIYLDLTKSDENKENKVSLWPVFPNEFFISQGMYCISSK